MSDIWHLTDIEAESFAAAAALFARHTHQQSVCRPALFPPTGNDDDSSEEHIDEEWEATVACGELHRAAGSTLKDRFLNRLSEVLAREKNFNSPPKQSTAKHVAASAWINSHCDSPVTIVIAKNEGLDERDRRLLRRLQTWLRAISATGRAPSKANDLLWDGREDKEGLIGYSQCRLEAYVSQIGQCKLDVSESGVDYPLAGQLERLLRLCGTYMNSPSVPALREVVDIAYELRCADWRHIDKPAYTKVLKAVFMLGRLRAAYECFKTTALSFPEFGSLEWRSIESAYGVGIKASRFCKQVQSLAKIIGRKRLSKGKDN